MLCSVIVIVFTWMVTLSAFSPAAAEFQTDDTVSFVRSENDCPQKIVPTGYRKAFRVSGYYVCMISAKEKGDENTEEKDQEDEKFSDEDDDFEESSESYEDEGNGRGANVWKHKLSRLARKIQEDNPQNSAETMKSVNQLKKASHQVRSIVKDALSRLFGRK
ncbi:uncharacterized protein LOC135501631 [Lineus longissimus]|uniref:uncharacterized protein LOC135501631 n=1 Tax=Lineus longissimus TaxID=88925 RepID=UPI002B4C3116